MMKGTHPWSDKLFSFLCSKMSFLPVLVMVFVAGCLVDSSPIIQKECEELSRMDDGGRLSVFITLESSEVEHVSIDISMVEVLVGDNWLPISESTIELDTAKISKGQLFLGSRVVGVGKYKGIRLTVSKANIIQKGQKKDLEIVEPYSEVSLSTPIEIDAQESVVFSLAWDAHSAHEMGILKPLVLRRSNSQTSYLAANKVYVSCPDINNIYIVRTDKNWVQESFYVSGRPTYIFADEVNKKLFILAEEEAKIKIFDMVDFLVSESIKIPMTRKPIFMMMMPDYETAFILDDLGNLIKMDVLNGLMLARARIGKHPEYVSYVAGQEKLVISSTFDNALYFVDPDTLEAIETVSLEGSPAGLLEWENYLYIAEGENNRVSLYDFNQRRLVKRLQAGYLPFRFIKRNDSIYVANKQDSTVSFMKGGLFFINKTISVPGPPAEMATAEYNRALYVANGGCDGNLAVIDLTSDRLIGKIDLGAKPFGLAVIQ